MKNQTEPSVRRGRSVPLSFFKYLTLGFLSLAVMSVQAQSGFTFTDANWVNTFGLPGASGEVSAMAADANGNVYVAGHFSMIGTIFATNIAEWNGTNWSALGSGIFTDEGVGCLATDGSGNVYAGGDFVIEAGGNYIRYLAEWNGANWSALGSGILGQVNSMVFDKFGNLYAGGSINSAGGQAVNAIAEWNGTNWSPLGLGVNGFVNSLAADGFGNLYAGGSFTAAGGETATNIAEWNGSVWSPLGTGLNGEVQTLAFDSSGNLYVGGDFTKAGGGQATYIAEWNGTNWSAVGSGLSGPCTSLVFDNSGDLYAGGYFSTVVGANVTNIADWNGSAWSTIGVGSVAFVSEGTLQVNSLLFDHSGNLYAGGDFTAENGIHANYLAKRKGTNWSPISSGMTTGTLTSVYSFAIDRSGNLYAGGQFLAAGGANTPNMAKWNGSTWSALVWARRGITYFRIGLRQFRPPLREWTIHDDWRNIRQCHRQMGQHQLVAPRLRIFEQICNVIGMR